MLLPETYFRAVIFNMELTQDYYMHLFSLDSAGIRYYF